MRKYYLLVLYINICTILSCKEQSDPPSDIFKQTWYSGKAEVSSYSLQQARYGEMRLGEAVLIFVTEDFSTDMLVKLDNPANTSNKQRVLKMNMTKKFITGIYPYSMMLSVFTPVTRDGNIRSLKASCTTQEWCGQTFSQLKLEGNDYHWQLNSYFENETDQDKSLDAVIPEDELWNQIRINPSDLPIGRITILPGMFWQRLSHKPMKEEDAILSLSGNDTSIKTYSINYPASERILKIHFKYLFPYEIVGWDETYPDGFGTKKRMLTTKAVLKKTFWIDYWKHNSIADSTYLDSLQLMPHE